MLNFQIQVSFKKLNTCNGLCSLKCFCTYFILLSRAEIIVLSFIGEGVEVQMLIQDPAVC